MGQVPYPAAESDFQGSIRDATGLLSSAMDGYASDELALLVIGTGEVIELVRQIPGNSILGEVNWYGSDGIALLKGFATDPTSKDFVLKTKLKAAAPSFDGYGLFLPQIETLRYLMHQELGSSPNLFYHAVNAYDGFWVGALALKHVLDARLASRFEAPDATLRMADWTYGISAPLYLDENGDRASATYVIYQAGPSGEQDLQWRRYAKWRNAKLPLPGISYDVLDQSIVTYRWPSMGSGLLFENRSFVPFSVRSEPDDEVLFTEDLLAWKGDRKKYLARTNRCGSCDLTGSFADAGGQKSATSLGTVFDLKGAHLKGANISYGVIDQHDLRNANLQDSVLSRSDLIGSDLRHANLKHLKAKNSNFTNADLSGANLFEALLVRSIFRSATLRGTQLQGANLEEADLSFAILEGANLSSSEKKTNILKNANLENAFLEKADLAEANLEGANLRKAHLTNADLSRAYLLQANLTGTELEGAILGGAIWPDVS